MFMLSSKNNGGVQHLVFGQNMCKVETRLSPSKIFSCLNTMSIQK